MNIIYNQWQALALSFTLQKFYNILFGSYVSETLIDLTWTNSHYLTKNTNELTNPTANVLVIHLIKYFTLYTFRHVDLICFSRSNNARVAGRCTCRWAPATRSRHGLARVADLLINKRRPEPLRGHFPAPEAEIMQIWARVNISRVKPGLPRLQ